jgi:repressor LexA
MESLTERQKEIYQWVRSQIVDRHLPPTMREIASRFRFAGPSGPRCHLRALERKGWIIRIPYEARGIRLRREPI